MFVNPCEKVCQVNLFIPLHLPDTGSPAVGKWVEGGVKGKQAEQGKGRPEKNSRESKNHKQTLLQLYPS